MCVIVCLFDSVRTQAPVVICMLTKKLGGITWSLTRRKRMAWPSTCRSLAVSIRSTAAVHSPRQDGEMRLFASVSQTFQRKRITKYNRARKHRIARETLPNKQTQTHTHTHTQTHTHRHTHTQTHTHKHKAKWSLLNFHTCRLQLRWLCGLARCLCAELNRLELILQRVVQLSTHEEE